MSGHNKWSSIKYKKAKADAQRGKVFTKLIRELTMAAKEGGGDPEANARLRNAIQAAKAANMPSDNIERAIKKGTGELPGVTYEEVTYEGYGPHGVAILVETVTDNKNRTAAEVRHVFDKYNGNLGSLGSVNWMFDSKGIITITKDENTDEDTLMEVALEAGADDMVTEDGTITIYTTPHALFDVKNALDEKGIKYDTAEVTKIPQTTVKLNEKQAESVLKLMNALDDLDDVQNTYTNFDIPDEIMEKILNKQ
ncbi:YebC/PmpR family DNA-binding transcriptional regulator [candidate division WOR-3 bacterium]|uniref:Probable transcriptional regulatory protein DRP44_00485 n=1 Tax=candidate division TA06 bacterium TaxID=2250710 RepID=A0A660SBC2_UNCT6|nr:YebC/PmpR family DNA-binding transcriptional regulator [candidate division WOR-3 bacterium]RKX68098.1 MAG: YebC/PmpR family DNA-binding transcriptional regulator [candidate division TA06 bacterium]HHD82483.1 YebC/PmpR family DNA-binding transcriptional regulator [Bacteroidota bacterium]